MSTSALQTGNEPPEPVLAVSRSANLNEVMRMFGAQGFGSFLPSSGAAALSGAGRYSPTEVTDPEIQEGWIFAAVDLLGLTLGMAQPTIYDGDPDEEGTKVVTSGPMVDLFAKPNTWQDSSILQVADSQNMALTGESFWYLLDRQGKPIRTIGSGPEARIDVPASICAAPGNMVRLELNKEGQPAFWETPSARGVHVKAKPGAVVQFQHKPDKNRAYRGIGPMAGAFGPAAQNYLARRYQTNTLRNDGKVGGLVLLGGFVTQPQLRGMQAEIDRSWNNPENAGKVRTLQGDAKFQETSRTPRELEYKELLKANKEEISAVFQTPGSLLGLDTTNYATFAGHFRRYLLLRIEPFLVSRARTINRFLFSRLRDPALARQRVAYDTEKLWRVLSDPEAHGRAIERLTKSGVPLDSAISLSGVRTDPLPGGDVPMVNASQIPLEAAQARGSALALKEQAAAATALQLAGIDPQEALDLAGIEAQFVEPEPEPEEEEEVIEEEEAEEGAVPEGDDEEEEAEKGLVERGTQKVPKLTSAQRRAAWEAVEKIRRPKRRTLDRALKGVYWKERKAQLDAIDSFAKTGLPPDPGPTPGPRLPQAAISPAELESFERAWQADKAEAATKPAGELVTFEAVCCQEELVKTDLDWRPRQVEWLGRHARLAPLGLTYIRTRTLVEKQVWSEEDIWELLIVNQRRWEDEIASKIQASTTAAWEAASRGLASEFGQILTSTEAISPDVLEALSRKAIKIAEGTTSTLANDLQFRIAQALSEGAGGSSLHAAVLKSLKEVNAATTRAFKTQSARALTIAKTEVAGSVSAARQDRFDRLAARGLLAALEWATSGLGEEPAGTVRHSHFAMEGQQVPPGTPFVSPWNGRSTLRPLGFGLPEEDINCSCISAGVPVGEENE